jgi:hypothetical protein
VTPAFEPLDVRRHAQDLRESWQGQGCSRGPGQMAAVVLSVLAHNFDEAMPILLRIVFPGFTSIQAPFYSSAAKIMRTGEVVADMVTRDGQIVRNAQVFKDEKAMEGAFRALADLLKLSDADRVQMFEAVKRWVVCDFRLDPKLDPRDPGAKRILQ